MKYNLGTTKVKDGGDWVYPKTIYIKQNGAWVPVSNAYVKTNGVWERIWPIPAGVLSSSTTNLTHTYYQNYADTIRTVTLTNTGDFDLTVNNITVSDSVNFTTDTSNFPSVPFTLVPGASKNVSMTVTGNVLGVSTGSINITNHVGYLGYANVTLTHTVNVLPDYSKISVTGPDTFNVAYLQDATVLNYTSYGHHSFTSSSNGTFSYVAAGGGGGGGGRDSQPGAAGYPGHLLTGSLVVGAGDTIDIYIGGGGGAGHSGGGGSAGTGGASASGNDGGPGGDAGSSGWSGGGGGGGAATVIQRNGYDEIIAAGGGGGGGGGQYSAGAGQITGYEFSPIGGTGETKTVGGDGGGGCVVSTAFANSGIWNKRQKDELIVWCEQKLHNKALGECFRRGYQVLGSKLIVPALKTSLGRKYYTWAFNNGTNLVRGKKFSILSVPNTALWIAGFMIVGAVVSKEYATKCWHKLYEGKNNAKSR